MRRGISPIIATVMLILIVTVIAATVGPWMLNLARDTTNQTSTDTDTALRCQNTAYDFDTDYATNGINWTPSQSELKVKITNTGTINVHNFSFEITVNTTIINIYNLTDATQRTSETPLKPGQSAILEADSVSGLVGSTLNSVKVLNEVCPSLYVEQDV